MKSQGSDLLVKVAIDAMGGDHAPGEIVTGAVAALGTLQNLHVTLVGKEDMVNAVLKKLNYPPERLSVVHAEDVIRGEDDPGLSMRGKKESSMVKALQLVRSGRANAVLSAGNTGAFMAGGVLFLGRIKGISRPALLTPMPGFHGRAVLFLDVGANMDARPEQLLQYAFMGRIYARQIMGYANPRLALLNVGIEPNKGNSQVKKAYRLFEKHLPGFQGNIEGTEVFLNKVDVVVCDGFVGNIFLKTAEGLSRTILNFFKQEIPLKLRYKVGAMLLKPVFLNLRSEIDDSGYGGAPLLGVNGLCIKCHGSSKAVSIEQALIKQVDPFVRKNVILQLMEAVETLSDRFDGDNNEQR